MSCPITFVLFNALHGFHSTSSPFRPELDRIYAAQRVIHACRPDILGITEACYSAANPYGQKLDYGRMFSMPSSHVTPWGQHEWANAILAKHQIESRKSIAFGSRTASRSRISIGGRFAITVDLCHTDPADDEETRCEALNRLINSRPRKHYVLMGDLNASWSHRSGMLEQLRASGMFDAMKGSSAYTAPTPPYRSDHRPPARIDFIWCSEDITVVQAGIIRTDDAEIASDHYPVYARVNLC